MRRLLLVAIVLAALVAPAGAAARTPGGGAQGKALATKVVRAHSVGARRRALLAALDALHVGVYTGKGKAIQRGAERGPDDLYAYDFELTALSDSFARKQLYSLDDMAATLNAAGFKQNGQPVTGASLDTAIVAGLKSARAHASSPASLAGLLTLDMGLPRHVDLSKPLDPSKPVLDPFQRWLIAAEIAGPAVHRHPTTAPQAPAAAKPQAVAASSCNNNTTARGGPALAFGKWLVGLSAAGAPAVLVFEATDLIHGVALGVSVKFSAVQTTVQTAWGELGPGSGVPVDFKAKAEMLDDYGESINCGTLAGYTIPPKGPIQGVQVHWDWDGLESQGTVQCDAACTQTGADGIASLHFTPFDEDLAGIGAPEINSTGPVIADAAFLFKNGNALGSAAELLGLTKSATFLYAVRSHQPPGFKFDAHLDGVDWGDGDIGTYDYHFRVCGRYAFVSMNPPPGQPPRTPVWTAKTHEHHTKGLSQFEPDPVDVDGTLDGVTFTRHVPTTNMRVFNFNNDHEYEHTLDVQLDEFPPQAVLTAHFDRADGDHLGDYTFTAPVQPDFSCAG